MPRWICPYCTHLSTVDPIVVGHELSCPACKTESTVIDADAEAISRLRAEKAAGEASTKGLRSVTISTIALAIIFALGMLLGLIQLANRHINSGLNTLSMLLISALILSPLLEGINELHRCRRLLEELVKKK